MMTSARRARLAAALAMAAAVAAACGGGSAPEPPAGATSAPATTSASPAAAAGGAAAAPGTGAVVAGERFTVRTIDDPMQGLPVGVLSVPAAWRFTSNVVWNYAWTENPVVYTATVENPANEEAVFAFPAAMYFSLSAASPTHRVGQTYGGLVFMPPQDPLQTMVSLIRQVRAKEQDLQIVGTKELSALAAALKVPPADQQRGLGVKVSYTMNGRPVEEEFYAVSYQRTVPYDGPRGRTYQIYWGLALPHSFRGPAGTLDARRPVYAAIVKSFRPNPEWTARAQLIGQYIAAEFNRQLQAGYDAIAAAGRLSQTISANNDAMLASIRASRAQAAASVEARRANDTFSDYIRGVETTNDPYYGTSQHSIDARFHWTDGYGSYRSTNDATADPNRTEVGNWTLLSRVR